MSDDGSLIEVRDKVASDLGVASAAGQFVGLTFTAEGGWADWDEELKESDGLRVDVVGNNPDGGDPLSRSRRKYLVSLDLYVRKKFGQSDRENGRVKKSVVDRLVKLVQELREFYDPAEQLAGTTDQANFADWDGHSKILFSWSRKHLRSGMFFGAVRMVFEVTRAIA